MKTYISKIFLLLFAFALSLNSTLAQLSVSFTISTYGGGNNVSCFGASDGWITANPSGGTPPYTYLWSNGATTQTISNLRASYYAVTVTDNVGASVENGVTLREPAQIVITLTSPEYSNGYNVSCWNCFNGSISTSVTGGVTPYTYSWADGPTSQNRSSLGGGTYRVTITDANNCTADKEITLTEPSRDDWTMTGNAGSNPTTHFLGTTDNADLVIRTNGTERMRIKANGDISATGQGRFPELRITDSIKVGNSVIIAASNTPGPGFPNRIYTDDGDLHINGSHTPTYNTLINPYADGKVGIGTLVPTQKLHVEGRMQLNFGVIQKGGSAPITTTGDLGLYSLVNTAWIRFVTDNGPFRFYSDGGTNDIGGTPIVDIEPTGNVGIGTVFPNSKLQIKGNGTTSSTSSLNVTDNNDASILFVRDDGKVGINTTTIPSAFRLGVNGKIICEELLVRLSGNWPPDFVFGNEYKLMSLKDLEQYIKANRHLPEIPSAADMQKNEGFEIGDLQMRLLQKIEEQTLYILDLQKQIDDLKEQIKK